LDGYSKFIKLLKGEFDIDEQNMDMKVRVEKYYQDNKTYPMGEYLIYALIDLLE
jgi:hypothetical protein